MKLALEITFMEQPRICITAPALVIQGHSQTLESSLSTTQISLSQRRCSNRTQFPVLGTSLF